MARPSRNIDQRLLDAGLALLSTTGCRNLSVRRIVERADVNLGMFHYHFKKKANFIGAVLERVYEEMFSELELQAGAANRPLVNLRNLLRTLVRFAHRHRLLMVRLLSDALAGERLPADFFRRNLPRHFRLIAELVVAAQKDGSMVAIPLPQAIACIVGAVASPLFVGTALQQHALLPAELGAALDAQVLSEDALDQRIDIVLRGLATKPEKMK